MTLSCINETTALVMVNNSYEELMRTRTAMLKEIRGSSKVSRACDEIESIMEYLATVAQDLSTLAATRDCLIPERVLGCASLLKLAASDVRVRIRGSDVLRRAVPTLESVERKLSDVSRGYAIHRRRPIDFYALQSSGQAAKLATGLEEWEAYLARKSDRPR